MWSTSQAYVCWMLKKCTDKTNQRYSLVKTLWLCVSCSFLSCYSELLEHSIFMNINFNFPACVWVSARTQVCSRMFNVHCSHTEDSGIFFTCILYAYICEYDECSQKLQLYHCRKKKIQLPMKENKISCFIYYLYLHSFELSIDWMKTLVLDKELFWNEASLAVWVRFRNT